MQNKPENTDRPNVSNPTASCSPFSVGDIVIVPIKKRWGIDCAATIEVVHTDTVDATVWNMDGPGANRLITKIPHSVCEVNAKAQLVNSTNQTIN